MADNVALPAATGNCASHQVTFSGDSTQVQIMHEAYITGPEGSKTLNEIHGNSTAATTAYGKYVRVVPQPPTLTGFVTTGSTNATSIKASAGRLRAVHVYNNAGYPVYVKFHNTAGTPTAGASIVSPRIGCQAGTHTHYVIDNGGKAFTTGIALTVVKDIADAGATAVVASDAIVEVEYE